MMKYRSALTLATLAVTTAFAVHVVTIQAQTSPASAELRKSYVSVLTQYRTEEQAFGVAKQEYIQLQTLGKLEVAVKAFRDVQTSRANTVVTYFTTLRAMVDEAKGMEVTKKEAIMVKLQTAIDAYKKLNSDVTAAQDRVALETTAKIFTDKQDTFESLSYETLALLRITAMQSALDQLSVTDELVKKQSEQLSDAARAEKQRGFDELDRRMEIVKTAIAKANTFHDRMASDDNYSESSYSQLVSALTEGYPELRQAENFLRELAGK